EGRVTSLALAGGTIQAGTDRDGQFVSTNQGQTWWPAGLRGQMVLAVCGDRLAGTDQGCWVGNTAIAGGAGVADDHWHRTLEDVVTAIIRSGDVVLAGTEEHGLFRSSDGGHTWQPCVGVQDGINALAAEDSRFVAATSVGRVFSSSDAGLSWAELERLPAAAMSVAIQGRTVLAGCYRAGLFELPGGGAWQPANEGLASTNAIDMLVHDGAPLLIAADGLRRLASGEWEAVEVAAPGDPRAAAVAPSGELVLATDQGLFAGDRKLGELTDVSLVRVAANGDLAVLTEDALHLRLGERWTQAPRSAKERIIDVAFSPSYPEDNGLLLSTVRQGTRTSVVQFSCETQEVSRLFDYDARSRWLAVGLPPAYRVDVRRPATFFAGTGNSLFRPAWPNDAWQRDILHDPNAIVLSMSVSPAFAADNTVLVGTTVGPVITRNGGLLWTRMDAGLADARCLKLLFAGDREVFCLTPTAVYRARIPQAG
ncbi:MAG: WD40/YVTN/BNR-like repeat-containing protein, partial [Chloroflexota bacterium]